MHGWPWGWLAPGHNIMCPLLWALVLFGALTPGTTAGPACRFEGETDCDGHDVSGGATNRSSVLTLDACCALCSATADCEVSVYIPDFKSDAGGAIAACLLKSACPSPSRLQNRIKCCQPSDNSCPPPPPPEPCPCSTCPCPSGVLPRTCDHGSVAASLPFCDSANPTETRVADLVSRLTRQEKINLVQFADTGFLPRLNLKEFNFYNTCLHGWWTSNVTTFGMPISMAATFDRKVMRQIAEVFGVESRALSQRDYPKSFDATTVRPMDCL